MFVRAELLWRELGRNMRVCLKCEIASGSDEKATNCFVLAADANRKIVNTQFSKMYSLLELEA